MILTLLTVHQLDRLVEIEAHLVQVAVKDAELNDARQTAETRRQNDCFCTESPARSKARQRPAGLWSKPRLTGTASSALFTNPPRRPVIKNWPLTVFSMLPNPYPTTSDYPRLILVPNWSRGLDLILG